MPLTYLFSAGQPPAILPSGVAMKPGVRDIPGGDASPRASSSSVFMSWTMIAKDPCTYTIFYLRQEQCLRDHAANWSLLRVMCRFCAGSGGRSAALPGGVGEALSTMIIFS
jgi:hypothetical protein